MLREMQSAFRARALDHTAGDAESFIRSDRIAAIDRLAVYTNNIMVSLIEVLEAAYPAIRRLIGEDNFGVLTAGYVRAQPPSAPRLSAYGDRFAEHVADQPAAMADLPFLADLARLEWACNSAYFAVDTPVLTPEALQNIPSEAYPGLQLTPHPATWWISSPYPIHDLWQAESLPDAWSETEQCVVVNRVDAQVAVNSATSGELALLSAFAAGATLAEAAGAAVETDPDLDLQTLLALHLSRGTFSRTLGRTT